MSRLPETGPSLRRYLTQQKRQAGRAANSSPFSRSGTGVTAEDEFTVGGALIVTGPMTVGGTLSLPAGIIDNDALAHPVIFDGTFNYASNFAVPTVFTQVVSTSFTVPDGMTSISFTVIGTVYVGNTSGVSQEIAVVPRRWTNGVLTNWGSPQFFNLSPGLWASLVAPYIYTDAVAAGDVIDWTLEVRTYNTALATNPGFTADIEVSITLAR